MSRRSNCVFLSLILAAVGASLGAVPAEAVNCWGLVANVGHPEYCRSARVRSDHEGAFSVEDLAPGSYRVSVSHPRELVVRHEDVIVDGDREVLIEIGAARVFGHVSSSGGEPLDRRPGASPWTAPRS